MWSSSQTTQGDPIWGLGEYSSIRVQHSGSIIQSWANRTVIRPAAHSLVCADDVELGFAEFSSGKRENVLLWIDFFNGKIKPAKTLIP